MKKLTARFLTILTLLMLALLTACNNQTETHNHDQQTLSPDMAQFGNQLTLDFQASPSKVEVGQAIQLKVEIHRQNEPATDATVKFEVWEKNSKEKHQLLDAKHDGQGVYSTSQSFSEEGEYLVVVHVTAPGVHQMVDGKFQVGQEQK